MKAATIWFFVWLVAAIILAVIVVLAIIWLGARAIKVIRMSDAWLRFRVKVDNFFIIDPLDTR